MLAAGCVSSPQVCLGLVGVEGLSGRGGSLRPPVALFLACDSAF